MFFLAISGPDSDGDGLSNLYELQVSGTNPNNPDHDGDGVNDGVEVLQGRNPKQAGWAPDSGGVIGLETFVPRR